MAEEIVLKANLRTVIGKQVKALRRQGSLPAVLYGGHVNPIPVTLDAHDANRLLTGLSSSHLVVIELNGERHNALVREKQRNTITGYLQHVDFQVVSMTEKLRATVPVALEGESPAVRNQTGVVVTGIEQLEVEALPSDLPDRIEVDLSKLVEIGDAIHVRDLDLPAAVEVLTDSDEMVVLITAPAAVEEEVEEVEAAEEEPEVIERGKKEEEEEQE